jgi:hypothetical protein
MRKTGRSLRSRETTVVALLVFAAIASVKGATAPGTTLVVEPPVHIDPDGLSNAMNATAGDLNGDGLPDVVIGHNSESPEIYYNNSTDRPFDGVPPITVAPGDPQQQAYLADLNGDQRLDIVAVGFNIPTKLYLNDGTAQPFDGVIGSDVGAGSTDSSTAAAIADVNGDGAPDIAVSNTNHHIARLYLNNGTAQPFDGVLPLNIGNEDGYAEDILLVDVNGDDRPDAILGFEVAESDDPSGVMVYINNGTQDPFGAALPIQILVNETAYRLATADFNQDGRPDLLVSLRQDRGNRVFLNTGSHAQPFDQPASLPPSPGITTNCGGLAAGDINEDGLPDAVFACGREPDAPPDAGLGAIYLNNGSSDPFAGVAAQPIPFTEFPDFTRSAFLADLDDDGGIEILLIHGEFGVYFPVAMDRDPIVADDTATTSAGAVLEWDVLANDTDTDGVLVRQSLAIVQRPLHGTARVNPGGYTIIYQPDNGFAGSDTLTYTVRDDLGVASSPATFAIRVQRPPVASNDAAVTTTGQATTINVIANDTSDGGTVVRSSLSIVTAPANGTTAINPNDYSITFSPAAGFTGTDTFQYRVLDDLGASSNVATVTVTVNSPPAPPTQPPTSGGGGGGGGGGAMSWLMVLALGALAAWRRVPR